MKLKLTLTAALVSFATAQLKFEPASVAGTINNSQLDEISGAFGMRAEGNEGKIITCHDSDDDYMFILNADGSLNSKVDLSGDDWRDAEEVIGYTDPSTNKNYVILCEFGDNPANRDKKYLFRFEEPTVNGSDITIAAGDWEKIAYRLPSTPVLEKGQNRGDFEGAFACPIDGKIYLFSKRMPLNHIYSLPIQSSYSGTQTLTFEGTMHPDVAQEFGGIISPANCVGAALSRDSNIALVKTYNKVFQFTRPVGRTWADVLVNDAPIEETNYVGLGSGTLEEYQGESITFAHDDSSYFTISEFRGKSSVPLFEYVALPPAKAIYSKSGDVHTFVVSNLDAGSYTIESSTDLVNWSPVTASLTETVLGNGNLEITFTDATVARKFFRFDATYASFAPLGYTNKALEGKPFTSVGTTFSVTLQNELKLEADVEVEDDSTIVFGQGRYQTLTVAGQSWTSTQWTSTPHLAYISDGDGVQGAFVITSNTTNGELVVNADYDLIDRFGTSSTIEIRPANTLGTIFADVMTDVAFDDRVWLLDGNSWVSYQKSPFGFFAVSTNLFVDANDTVIFPEEGLFYLRTTSADLNVTATGDVPQAVQSATVVNSALLSSNSPVATTLAALNLNGNTWFPDDRAYIWNSNSNSWDAYLVNAFGNWAPTSNQFGNANNTVIEADGAVFVDREVNLVDWLEAVISGPSE